jgi:hypothetical protein
MYIYVRLVLNGVTSKKIYVEFLAFVLKYALAVTSMAAVLN